MRRIIIGLTALTVLAGATAAWAATSFNSYGGGVTVKPHAAGSKKKPVPVSWTSVITVKGNNGNNAAPLTEIKTTIYGMTFNTQALPTCSAKKINAAQNDNVCPKKALVASGYVNAELGSPTLTGPTSPCDPLLHVWNAGKNTLNYFFVETAQHPCSGVSTGQVPPYPGHLKQSGPNLVLDVPLPPDVSTRAGNLPFYGSLVKQYLVYRKATGKVGGKTVGFFSTVACKKGKRPYSVAFTATNGHTKQTVKVSEKDKC